MGGHFFLQGIFPTQGSNLRLSHCRWILYRRSHWGSHVCVTKTAFHRLSCCRLYSSVSCVPLPFLWELMKSSAVPFRGPEQGQTARIERSLAHAELHHCISILITAPVRIAMGGRGGPMISSLNFWPLEHPKRSCGRGEKKKTTQIHFFGKANHQLNGT